MLRATTAGVRHVSTLRNTTSPSRSLWLPTRQCRTRKFPEGRRFLAIPQLIPTRQLAVQNVPSPQYLEEEEISAKTFSKDAVHISLTDRAAEKLRTVSETKNDSTVALRLAVDSGGCHGFQYRLELANQTGPDDYRLSHPSIPNANMVIDAVSLPMVNGISIDYPTELIGSQFTILENPNAVGGGCGCGVSWELKPGILD